MTEMVYKFKDAARFHSGFDRAAGAQRLADILRRDGSLEVPAIVEDGCRPESPLHPEFDVSAEEALEEVWAIRAEYLQRSFVTVVTTEDGSLREVRAVVPVFTREDPDQRHQISTIFALSDEDYREQVLHRALEEMLALRRKYADLEELARIFKAIDRTAKELAA